MTVGLTIEQAIDLLPHDSWPFRLAAVRFLASATELESVRQALIQALSDDEELIQAEAVRALVRHLDDPEVLDAMLRIRP